MALICARGGSKGIPRKNLQLLGGRPLIEWSIEAARRVDRIARVIVSTDCEEIAAVAATAGAEVPFKRPLELATDDASEWLVWRHALAHVRASDGYEPDALIVLPPTAPLRATEDVERCLDEFSCGGADVVITVTDAHRNPCFNMVRLDADGSAHVALPPGDRITRRQDAPVFYDMTTVAYVARPAFVTAYNALFEGAVRSVWIPPSRAVDIDSPLDLLFAECLIGQQNR